MVSKQKVLFICTGKSCRSQIAEGLLNKMAAKYFKVYSAGSHPSRVHPNAISVMKEIKIDISNHPKLACPIFPIKLCRFIRALMTLSKDGMKMKKI